MEKLLLPAVDLEQWYQELMAGLGTSPTAASPRSSPPPLPAKASRQLQVTPSFSAHPCPGPAPPANPSATQHHLGWSIQPGQQGPLDPGREVRVSSWAAILVLGVWRVSLLSPRVLCLTVQWKGFGSSGQVRDPLDASCSARPSLLCPWQPSPPERLTPSGHLTHSLACCSWN